jgi:hypothetical protein
VGNLALPQPISGRSSRTLPDFGDSSAPLFSIYSKRAEREDDRTAERWQKDAQVILIFVSLLNSLPHYSTPN